MAFKPLTVGFHETPFLTKLNQENQFGFWFQLSRGDRHLAGNPWGPSNPQALNRYSYVQNNPLKYTDPSGHCPACAAVGGMLGIAGITVSAPVIAAIAAIASIGVLAVFLSDAGNRDWLAAQIEGGITNVQQFADNFLLMARKEDLRYIDYLARKHGLTREQRRRLHDAITKRNLSREEIEEIAEELTGEGKGNGEDE